MPFFRQRSDSWVLFFCLLLVALICRLQAAKQHSAPPEAVPERPPVSRPANAQAQQLKSFVSGAVGIQPERGDSIQVIVR